MIEEKFISTLKEVGVDHFLSLPCEKIKKFIQLAAQEFNFVSLNREEEGLGIGAGLWMAGKKPIMVIQNSGFGNCVNALLSLNSCYKIPLPILMSWRGVYGEKIDTQKPFGRVLPRLLKSLNIDYVIFNGKNYEAVRDAIDRSYKEEKVVAVLLRPDIWDKTMDFSFARFNITPKNIDLEGEEALYTREEFLRGIAEEIKG